MKERILKNPISSILGFSLALGAMAALYSGKASLTEVGAFLPFCLGLIYSKDAFFKGEK